MASLITKFKSLLQTETSTISAYPPHIPFDDNPCLSCSSPCETHPQLPSSLESKIDTIDPLVQTVKPYQRHVFLCTNNTTYDWEVKIENVQGSLANELRNVLNTYEAKLNYRIAMTACDRHSVANPMVVGKSGDVLEVCDLMIFPETKLITSVHLENVNRVMTTWFTDETVDEETGCKILDLSEEGIVFVCAHKKRDKRCGVAGPLLIEEFKKCLHKRNISETRIAVHGCSHTGGHKFAGNVIVFPHGHWYGRVKTCHVDNLVERHLLGGKIIMDLWRGKMTEKEDLAEEPEKKENSSSNW